MGCVLISNCGSSGLISSSPRLMLGFYCVLRLCTAIIAMGPLKVIICEILYEFVYRCLGEIPQGRILSHKRT